MKTNWSEFIGARLLVKSLADNPAKGQYTSIRLCEVVEATDLLLKVYFCDVTAGAAVWVKASDWEFTKQLEESSIFTDSVKLMRDLMILFSQPEFDVNFARKKGSSAISLTVDFEDVKGDQQAFAQYHEMDVTEVMDIKKVFSGVYPSVAEAANFIRSLKTQ